MSKYLAPFDTETGGLIPGVADLLTFYMCIVEDETMKIVDELYLKLKPDGGRLPITEQKALDVNKIDVKAHLADPETVTYAEGRQRIEAMLKKWLKPGKYKNIRPMGQNVDFDIRFVQHFLLPEEVWNEYFHYAKIDTKLVVDFLKDCGWFPRDLGGLETVIRYLQLPLRDAHNAKEDTLMMFDMYKALIAIMQAKKDGGSTQDLISLLEAEG